jgi:hypothetical protein
METSMLTLHFCGVHDLLFFTSLPGWLSFPTVQIEHTLGEVLCLKESACPRCTTVTKVVLQKQSPSSVPRVASGF